MNIPVSITGAIQQLINDALTALEIEHDGEVVVDYPVNLSMGDFASPVAMKLGKQLGQNPKELAEQIVDHTSNPVTGIEWLEKVEVAGLGFVNFTLSKQYWTTLKQSILESNDSWGSNSILEGKTFLAEHTDPNLFKEFHIGHLVPNTIGESIHRIAEFHGANVPQVTFQGDVGLHVAKTLWGMMQNEPLDESEDIFKKQAYLGACYVAGEKAYSLDDEAIKQEIVEINKKVYSRADEEQNRLYEIGSRWSLGYFDYMYDLLGSEFNEFLLESLTFADGQRIVEEHIGSVFEKSDGAVIFRGSNYPKLHDRVFINSENLPTYEAKDIGLFYLKWQKYNPDISMTVTGMDQQQYFQVVKKAAGLINPEWEEKTVLVCPGILNLASGKMSSRKGEIVRAKDMVEDVTNIVLEKMKDRDIAYQEQVAHAVALAGIKYTILKSSVGKDMVYDEQESLSFEGDTGPYIQYAYVRAINAVKQAEVLLDHSEGLAFRMGETPDLERMLVRFPHAVERALDDYSPHHIAGYVYELASEFNSFYAQTKIADADNPDMVANVELVRSVALTLKNGLWLLGIETVDEM